GARRSPPSRPCGAARGLPHAWKVGAERRVVTLASSAGGAEAGDGAAENAGGVLREDGRKLRGVHAVRVGTRGFEYLGVHIGKAAGLQNRVDAVVERGIVRDE